MNVLDIVIVLALLFSLVSGFRRGFWLALTQYLGMLAGIIAGVLLAPRVADAFNAADPTSRQVIALLTVMAASVIGGSVGFWAGGPLRRWLLNRPVLGALDNAAGALFSAAVTLVFIWLLAISFARGPQPDVARAIQESRIVAEIDASAPQAPAFLAKVQQMLSGSFLPPIFLGLEPDLPDGSAPDAASARTAGVQQAAASTVRIEGLGCGGVSTGSGFPVSGDLVVTNAHVVSGTSRTTVRTPEGQTRAAAVVVFDPELDVAVLRVRGLDLTPLAPVDGRAGASGAVIGYPGGGPLTVVPAVAARQWTARGRDIYNEQIVTRTIWIVSARVRPGNSGGPLVDEQGRYLGVIFGASVSDPNVGYALTADEVAPAIEQAGTAQQTIDTRRFACPR